MHNKQSKLDLTDNLWGLRIKLSVDLEGDFLLEMLSQKYFFELPL